MRIDDLVCGQIINNKELVSIFECSTQGGMRKSNKTNSLVIISNHVESLYDDRWEGEILLYTGMGTAGDQSFDFMQNKTLFNSNSNGVQVFLFEVFRRKEYTFMGHVKLAKEPFFEKQVDVNNDMRQVCIFPLKTIDNTIPPTLDEEILRENFTLKEKRVKRLDNESLLRMAKRGKTSPGVRNTKSMQYERDVFVAEYVKRLANGICQLCGEKAPFCRKDGEPYLETHHIIWLSRGGSDTIDNTIALCPNCHARMHIIDCIDDKNHLKKQLEILLKNITLFVH